MKLTAYGGSEIPNLGSCQVYIKGPNNANSRLIQAEVVDVDGPAIIHLNHTAAILVKTIDFASLGSPCPRFEAFQNVANKGFYSHGNKHGGGVIKAHRQHVSAKSKPSKAQFGGHR